MDNGGQVLNELLIAKSGATSVGRPRSIDEYSVRKLVDALKRGHTISTACRISGIPRSTYYDELARNEEFSDRIAAARDVMTMRATALINHSIRRGDLKVAMWWLDRQDRRERNAQRAQEYRLIKKLTVTSAYQETRSVEIELNTTTN